jgi:hypothetical protein
MALQSLPVIESWFGDFASMLISRKLAQKVHDRHTVIIELIKNREQDKAIAQIHSITKLLERYIESDEDAEARARREHD